LEFDLEGLRERGIAARDRTRDAHHVLRGTRFPRAGCGRGGALGAAGAAQPVHLADHGAPRHIAEFRGNLTGRQSAFPEFIQLLDAIVGPGQYRHRILPSLKPRPVWQAVLRCKSPKNLSRQNPLALAGRGKRARTFTQDHRTPGIKTAARDVVPDKNNATIWRDSRARVRADRPHVPSPAKYGCFPLLRNLTV